MSVNSDPTNWPQNMPELREIDNLLRCNICFEYLNTAMILPACSHNYCSLCIRRFMNYKSQCPTCNTAVLEPEIRNNRILDNLVQNFLTIRNRVLKAVSNSGTSNTTNAATGIAIQTSKLKPTQSSTSKETSVVVHSDDDTEVFATDTKKLKSSRQPKLDKSPPCTINNFLQRSSDSHGNTSSHTEDADISIIENPLSPNSAASIVKADCPVCGVSVPERRINEHLDKCLARSAKKESLRSSAPRRKPLPKLVYNLMSDKELRKKMKEHGLTVQGNRQVLIKRLQEFTLLYNSQCDSENPKSAAVIVKELEKAEKTKSQLATSTNRQKKLVFEKGDSEEEIAKKKQEYAKAHKSQFDSLIANARNAMKQKIKKKAETVTQEDETTSASTSQVDTSQAMSSTTMETDTSESMATHQQTCSIDTDQDDVTMTTANVVGSCSDEDTCTIETVLSSTRNSDKIDVIRLSDTAVNDSQQVIDLVPSTSGITCDANSDSDFSTSARMMNKSSRPRRNAKTATKKVKKTKRGQQKDESSHGNECSNVETEQQGLEIKMVEAGECQDIFFENKMVEAGEDTTKEDPSELLDDNPGSPSIFDNATQPSPAASSPIFGNGSEPGNEQEHSPQSTPSLGFGPMETASDVGSHSDVLFDVNADKLLQSLESPVTPTPRRTLRKRKNDIANSGNSSNASSSGEIETTKRKRRRATKK